MEQQPAMSWPESLHENSLIAPAGDDEFSNFLEFNMHFSDLEGHGPAQSQSQAQAQAPHSQLQQQHAMVTPTTSAPDMTSDPRSHPFSTMEGLAMDFNGHGGMSQPQPHAHPGPIPYSTPSMTPGFCAQDASQPSNQSYMQGQQMIPPTPNSMELHGNAARYSHRDEHSEIYDRYSRINEEQVCPTPT